MPDLEPKRRKLRILLIILASVDVVAIILFLSPLVGSQHARREQQEMLWKELQQKTRQVEPLRGLSAKIAHSRLQIAEFYKDRIPDRDSAISDALGRVAAESGVRILQVRSQFSEPEAVNLQPVQIEASLSGDYLQLVRFINGLERDQLFFLVDSVQLAGDQGGTVRLQVKLRTYLRSGA
jgi:Tfp pilus assembly protein PilO